MEVDLRAVRADTGRGREGLPATLPGPTEESDMTPALEADPKEIERRLEEDRRAVEQARARNAEQRVAARRAERAIRSARTALRRAAAGR